MIVPELPLDAVRTLLGCRELTVRGTPTGAGWSNLTVFVCADGRDLVLRLAPGGPAMFASYDLSAQVRCQRHARAHGLPVPEIVAADLTGETLGRPGYLMERVIGRVPSDDDPPFTRAGFLVEADRPGRRAYSAELVDRLAQVHGLPVLDGLPIGPHPADHLAWCEQQRAGLPAASVLDRAHAALASTAPPDDPRPALLWGDARPANTVVDAQLRIVALLDWELAGTGHPGLDVAWLNEMNHLRAGTDPPLPGFLTEDEVWQRWAERTGRTTEHRDWFRLFAAYRVAVLLDLHLADRVRHGVLPADHPVRTENRARRRLTALLTWSSSRRRPTSRFL